MTCSDITKVSHYSDQVYSVCHVHRVLEQLSCWSNFPLHHNGLLRLWMKDVTSMKHMVMMLSHVVSERSFLCDLLLVVVLHARVTSGSAGL